MKLLNSNDKAETTKTAISENVVLGQIKLEDLIQERLEVRKRVEKNTVAKKTVEKKAVSAAKAVAAETKPEIKAAEVVEEVKTAEVAEEAKIPETVAETKTEEEPVKAAAKKTTKAAAKKTTKTTAKKETETKPAKSAKTAKAAVSQKIVLQVGGRADLSIENLVDRVKEAYVAEGHSAASIKNIEVYIKLEECMAYYVIDGYASGIRLY